MTLLLRPLHILVTTALLGVALNWGPGGADGAVASPDPRAFGLGGPIGSDPIRLPLLREALAPVGETYVLPDRVDPERMLRGALRSVERHVPETLFQRDESLLHVHVGDHRSAFTLAPVQDLDTLQATLEQVAGVLVAHLEDGDVEQGADHHPLRVALEMVIARGVLGTLDPHTALLAPEASRRMDVENRGEFGGLGIQIAIDDERLIVDQVLPGHPAAVAGVRDRDHVRRIDGQSTINLTLDETVELLRGPVGAPVSLEIVRAGEDAPIEVVVHRANIKILEVEAWAMPGGVAYVRLPSFHATAAADLQAHLRRLAREEGGLRGVVLDLRDNPGGYLNQAIDVADLFLGQGEIVSTRGPRDVRPRAELARPAGTLDATPMAVLVNAWSASASEIVAGALRAHGRAVIVGERTFGKGSVQNLHPLPYDARLKLTIAHYLTPGDRSIQSVGIPADVELVHSVVGWREDPDGRVPDALMYGREWVRREADLDEHLEGVSEPLQDAAYRLRWVDGWDEPDHRAGQAPDPADDGELRFAMALIQGAAGPSRAEILAGADALVTRWRRDQDRRSVEAFEGIGLDWRDGPTVSQPRVDMQLAIEGDELAAGQTREVTLTVVNRSPEPLSRVVVVAEDHDVLEGREFLIGRLEPGASRSWTRSVALEDGYPAETSPVRLSLRDASEGEIATAQAVVRVRGQALPRLAWSWELVPGDVGVVAVDEVVRLRLTVRNVGDGPATGATARIRNRSGRALDILTGTLHAGTWRVHGEGVCSPSAPGWIAGAMVGTDDPDHPRVRGRLPPVWPEGCAPVLAPGESWTGDFEVEVREPFVGSYALDLTLREDRAYDWATVVREGFSELDGHEERVTFDLGSIGRSVPERVPPRIELTRLPPDQTAASRVTVSGRVTDDVGVDWVTVFAGEDKVGLEDVADTLRLGRVPFTADVPLGDGATTVSVVARDAEGWTTTTSRVVWREPEALRAQVDPATLP